MGQGEPMLQARRKVATSLIVRKSALEKYRVVSDIQGLVYAPPTAGDEGAAIVARAGIAHYDSFGGADVVLEGGYGYGSKPNKRRRVIRARGQSQGSAEHEWVKEHPPQEVIQPGRKGKIVARTAGGSYAYSAAAALAFMKDPDFVNETRGRRNLVHIANCEGDHLCGATLDQRTQEGYRPAESLFDFSPAYAREDEDDDEDYAAPVGKKRKAPSAPSPAPRKRTKRSSKSSMDYEHDLNSPTLTKEQIRDVARDLGGVGNSDAPRFVVDQDGSDEIPAEAQEVLLSMVDSDAATIASPETVQLLQLRRLNDSHVFVKFLRVGDIFGQLHTDYVGRLPRFLKRERGRTPSSLSSQADASSLSSTAMFTKNFRAGDLIHSLARDFDKSRVTDEDVALAHHHASAVLNDYSDFNPPTETRSIGQVNLTLLTLLIESNTLLLYDLLVALGFDFAHGALGFVRSLVSQSLATGIPSNVDGGADVRATIRVNKGLGIDRLLDHLVDIFSDPDLAPLLHITALDPKPLRHTPSSSASSSTPLPTGDYSQHDLWRVVLATRTLPVEGTSCDDLTAGIGSSEPGTLFGRSPNPEEWDDAQHGAVGVPKSLVSSAQQAVADYRTGRSRRRSKPPGQADDVDEEREEDDETEDADKYDEEEEEREWLLDQTQQARDRSIEAQGERRAQALTHFAAVLYQTAPFRRQSFVLALSEPDFRALLDGVCKDPFDRNFLYTADIEYLAAAILEDGSLINSLFQQEPPKLMFRPLADLSSGAEMPPTRFYRTRRFFRVLAREMGMRTESRIEAYAEELINNGAAGNQLITAYTLPLLLLDCSPNPTTHLYRESRKLLIRLVSDGTWDLKTPDPHAIYAAVDGDQDSLHRLRRVARSYGIAAPRSLSERDSVAEKQERSEGISIEELKTVFAFKDDHQIRPNSRTTDLEQQGVTFLESLLRRLAVADAEIKRLRNVLPKPRPGTKLKAAETTANSFVREMLLWEKVVEIVTGVVTRRMEEDEGEGSVGVEAVAKVVKEVMGFSIDRERMEKGGRKRIYLVDV